MRPRPAPSAQQVLLHNLKQVIGAVHGCVRTTGGPGPCRKCSDHAVRVADEATARPLPRHLRHPSGRT